MSFATVPLHYAEVQVADIPTFQHTERYNTVRFKDGAGLGSALTGIHGSRG